MPFRETKFPLVCLCIATLPALQALLAAQQVLAAAAMDYGTVWEAVIERVGLTMEGYRQRLCSLRWEELAQPFLFVQRVLDSVWRWLQLERRDLERIVEQMTLEQFMATMPTVTADWLQPELEPQTHRRAGLWSNPLRHRTPQDLNKVS
uniref:SCAN box domain-containing protein n=1 Tax=Scleropages formosus TaxID=113540 RepID=A0A8C9R952_SCLFO